MSNASYVRNNFLGGEWSLEAQGRMDLDAYLTAMNLSYNGFPTETGAWVRRSGTYNVGPTRRGAASSIHELHFNQQNSYIMQFDGNGHLRFSTDGNPVLEAAKTFTVTAATPPVLTAVAHGYTTGDSVIISYDAATAPNEGVAALTGRMYRITVLSVDTFSLQDEVTGSNIVGTGLTGSAASLRVRRVVDFATPYTTNYSTLRTVQNQNVCFVLSDTEEPYAVDMEWDGSNITFAAADFLDGPYLDAVSTVTQITPSATTGSVTLEATLYDNVTPSNIFAATDVGRHIRLLEKPDPWDAGTAYAIGDSAEWKGGYYIALEASTGVQPDSSITAWGVNPRAEHWTWAEITAFTDANTVTALIRGEDLIDTFPKRTYRMGLYSDTTGWPNAGAFHDGRFWLSGVMPNRIDASQPAIDNTTTISFSPTNVYGQVADDNGIAAVLMATDVAGIQWFMPSDRGLIVGTRGGEWLISASTQNDPMTPTNIIANRVTKFKSPRYGQAISTPLSTVFVQALGRSIIEYVPDGTEGGKFGGRDLADKAKHLTAGGISKIAYQNEPTPLIWAIGSAGELRTITYRRESPWASQPPEYYGWSQHSLGTFGVDGRVPLDIVSGPSPDGAGDAITIETWYPSAASPTTSHRIEVMNAQFEEGDVITGARLLDHSRTPTLALANLTNGVITSVTLYGLWYLEGEDVSVFFGGVDAGEFTVASGEITVPVPSDNGLLTAAYIQEFATSATTTGSAGYGSALVLGPTGGGGAAPVTQDEIWQAMGVGNVDAGGGSFLIDWDNLIAVIRNGTTVYVSSLVDGSYTGVTDTVLSTIWGLGPFTTDDEFFYIGDGDAFGRLRIYKHRFSDLSLVGTVSNSLVQTYPGNMGVTQSAAGGPKLIVYATAISGSSVRVRACDMDSFIDLGNVINPVPNNGTVRFSNYSTPGVLIGMNGPANAEGLTEDMVLYRFDCSGSVVTPTTLATITPNDIEAGATSWIEWDGPVMDETDNNPIFIMTANTGVPKLVKYNATTGAEMWRISLSADVVLWNGVQDDNDDAKHQQNRIQNSTLVLFGATLGITNDATRWIVDTAAGTATTSVYTGIEPSGYAYNDTTGHFVFKGEYIPGIPGSSPIPSPEGYTNPAGWAGSARVAFLGPTVPAATDYIVPIVAGLTFTSKGQVTRPILQSETGARNGPRFGKTSRIHQAAYMFNKTQDVSWGTSFNELQQLAFAFPGGALYTELDLFSGTWQDTMNDNYNIDASQLCWQSDGPFPLTVLAVGGFIETNDR